MQKLNEDYSVKDYVNENGMLINEYYYKGDKAFRANYNTKIAKLYSAYTIILKDLNSSKNWLEYIKTILKSNNSFNSSKTNIPRNGQNELMIAKGLIVGAITFYGKCFSQSKGRRVSLNKGMINKNFHSIHDMIIRYRNNYTAHSGDDMLENSKTIIVLPIKMTVDASIYYGVETNQPYTFTSNYIEDILKLVNHVIAISESKQSEIEKKLANEIREIDLMQFYKKI